MRHKTIQRPYSAFVYNEFGRVVGAIEGNTLRKRAKGSKHMLRKPLGWAYDKAIINQAKQAKVTKVEIIDTETGVLYRSNLKSFSEFGIPIDRGYGSQTCLPIRYWKTSEWNPSSLVRPPRRAKGSQTRENVR